MLGMLLVSGQETGTPPAKTGKFHLAVNYSYLNTDLTLRDMSLHSIWNEHDYGVQDLDQEDVDQVNAITTFNKRFSGIGIEAGVTLLNKPGSPWRIDGSIIGGLMKVTSQTRNNNVDTMVLKVSSGMNNPVIGLKFRFDYAFNTRWGVSLAPYFIYSWGHPSDIDDRMNARVVFFNETRKYAYDYLYARITPLAFYNLKHVRISAGPGFYYMYLSTEYQLKRIDPNSGASFDEFINSRLTGKYFIDGSLAAEWRIINGLALNAFVGIGSNIICHAGIVYTF
jgi:hypothetical protein